MGRRREKEWGERREGHARLDELPPLLLAVLALHPLLVELDDAVIRLDEELGEVLFHVFVDLVIEPVRVV